MKPKTATIPAGYRFNDKDEIEMSSAKCAEFFDVSDWTVRDWGSKGAPQVDRGWWNPKEIVKWLGKGRTNEEPESDAARKLKAEADLKEAQALKAEFENAVSRGEYLHKSEVAQGWAQRCIEFKNFILSLTRSVSNRFTDNDIRIVVEEAIREESYNGLEQFSREGKYTPKTKGKR